jgi:hypothetical protein
MVLLGDDARVEGRFGRFGESANRNARWMRGLRRTYWRHINHFGRTRWDS